MARAYSMATIEQALQAPITATEPTTKPEVSDPHAAPGVTPGTPVTAPVGDTETEGQSEEESKKSERQRLIDEALAKRQAEKEQDAFNKSASSTLAAASRIAHGASVRLERIPTPGSVILPLLVLFVFFLLLLPVNGHTRFVWLWLVFTGNAQIGTPAPADTPGYVPPNPGGIFPVKPAGTDSGANGNLVTPLVFPGTFTPIQFTGAQEPT